MEFKYSIIPAKPDGAFPNRLTMKRPILLVGLEKNGKSVTTWSIVDSGADFCVFPASIAQARGISIPNQNAVPGIRWPFFRPPQTAIEHLQRKRRRTPHITASSVKICLYVLVKSLLTRHLQLTVPRQRFPICLACTRIDAIPLVDFYRAAIFF